MHEYLWHSRGQNFLESETGLLRINSFVAHRPADGSFRARVAGRHGAGRHRGGAHGLGPRSRAALPSGPPRHARRGRDPHARHHDDPAQRRTPRVVPGCVFRATRGPVPGGRRLLEYFKDRVSDHAHLGALSSRQLHEGSVPLGIRCVLLDRASDIRFGCTPSFCVRADMSQLFY
jgi:hypothetical protein